MKTLKFMLAAATAIGLASATQADQWSSTGFETLDVGAAVSNRVQDTRSGYSYFYYTGANAEDNESTIIAAADVEDSLPNARPRGAAGVDAGRAKVLQVSTGVDPLLRTFLPLSGGNLQEGQTFTDDTYVDALVQFTVTPYTDPVTPGENDKLMIYLKEYTNSVGEVEGTNLVVIGGYCNQDGEFEPKEYYLTPNPEINPNTWHRLTVKAIANYGGLEDYKFPAFQVFLDGDKNPCVFDSPAVKDTSVEPWSEGDFPELDDVTVVFSLKCTGTTEATLQAVGFSGEGKVDDLMMTTVNPFATVFDFTFSYDNTKVSAVSYTIGETTYTYADTHTEIEEGTQITINSITYVDAWMAGSIDAVGLSNGGANVYYITNNASLTITPEKFFPRTETAGQDGTAAHPYEVADAAALSALQKGVLAGKNLTGVNFVQTGDINMSGVTDFYGIGWFKSSDSYASLPPGLPSASTDRPFTGVYDGGGYKISNVRLVRHNYAGVFNCVEGTVKNLTVENLGFVDTSAGEWGCGIVGNAQGTAVLEYLTAATSAQDGFWGDNAPHNTAGIAARAEDSATIRYCVNNAAITASAKRLGGIISFTGTAGAASDVVSIIGCTNNGALYSSDGTRGVGGIIASPESATAGSMTLIKDCANFGELTVASGGYTGAIVGSMGVNANSTWQDDGGNTFLASANLVGTRGSNTKAIVGLAYALPTTINNADYLTTVAAADLAAGNTYTLLANVAASETPVFTLAAAGDTIAFDTVRGFTFAGTVDGDGYLTVTPATVDTVTTYTAVLPKYEITFVSGEGAATNVQEVDAGTTPVPPTAAAVAGKTFTAWSPVVAIATAPATYTATYDWVTYTITYKNADDSVFTDWASEYTAPTSFTAETPVALPVAANVDVSGTFNSWTNESGTVTSTSGLYANLVVFANVAESAGWDEDPAEGKTAAQEYPALAGTALASADAKKLTTWAKSNSVTFADAGAAAADSTLVEAFMLNCAPTAEAVAAEKADFKATITVNADGTITVTAPEGYNVTPQMKGATSLSGPWDDISEASDSYQFYKFELSL